VTVSRNLKPKAQLARRRQLAQCRGPALEALLHFAMTRALGIASAAIAGDHSAPKCHGARVAHIFDDYPVAGEPIENQCRRVAAHAHSAMLFAHEEFRHSIVRGRFTRGGNTRTSHQRKTHAIGPVENQQRMRVIVGKPVSEDFIFVRIVSADDGEQTRIQIGQGVDVFGVNALDPLAILFRMSAVANTD
jgi:hypothetical protein